MSGFLLNGFNRVGFLALIANQIVLAICASQNALITPVFSIISTVVLIWWDWHHTSWIRSFTPGKTSLTREDVRQIRISSLIFLPSVLVIAYFSFPRVVHGTPSVEWILNAANLFAFAIAGLSAYFKHLRI